MPLVPLASSQPAASARSNGQAAAGRKSPQPPPPAVQLLWPGRLDADGRRRTPRLQPARSREVLGHIGQQTPSGRLIRADFRVALSTVEPGSIDFIYVDPPFGTDRDHRLASRRNGRGPHALHARPVAYGDRRSVTEYLNFLDDLIALSRAMLRETGSIALHVDHRASAHARCLLDEHFGPERFINELIWKYGLGNATASRHFLRKHDTILVYARSPRYYFNRQRGPLTEAQRRKYCHEDARGRFMMSYGKRYDLKGGKPLESVLDIPALAATHGERCGYPTQKPLRLLEVLIESLCPPGGVVLDPCCGSATTAAAAQRSGRYWIAIDEAETAIRLSTARLQAEPGAAFAVERIR